MLDAEKYMGNKVICFFVNFRFTKQESILPHKVQTTIKAKLQTQLGFLFHNNPFTKHTILFASEKPMAL